ncbi:MAG: hypothetical protein JXA92_03335 [candidate division Zixibacteria bacterium]|nr:hypothetical protein [candidate division Zixibacteria bacterium]
MWIGYNEQGITYNEIFVIMGKGLRLCQNLEFNIKHIVTIIKIVDEIKKGVIRNILDENLSRIVNQVEKYFLKNGVQQISNSDMSSKDIIEKLEAGRIATVGLVPNSPLANEKPDIFITNHFSHSLSFY